MAVYQLYFYVPETHLELVKEAIFEVGAGTMGTYSRCSWQVKGEGQFCSDPGSKPYIGDIGEVTKMAEFKVETLCTEQNLEAVLMALHKTHPYEMPAYGVLELIRNK